MSCSFLHDAHVSATRLQCWLSLIPVFGVLLVMAGCVLATGRGISRELQRKDEARARMAREMKPPLPESPVIVWWETNGKGAMAMAAGILAAVGAAIRKS